MWGHSCVRVSVGCDVCPTPRHSSQSFHSSHKGNFLRGPQSPPAPQAGSKSPKSHLTTCLDSGRGGTWRVRREGPSDQGSACVSLGRALGRHPARSPWILASSCHPLKGQIALTLQTAASESPRGQITHGVFFGTLMPCSLSCCTGKGPHMEFEGRECWAIGGPSPGPLHLPRQGWEAGCVGHTPLPVPPR